MTIWFCRLNAWYFCGGGHARISGATLLGAHRRRPWRIYTDRVPDRPKGIPVARPIRTAADRAGCWLWCHHPHYLVHRVIEQQLRSHSPARDQQAARGGDPLKEEPVCHNKKATPHSYTLPVNSSFQRVLLLLLQPTTTTTLSTPPAPPWRATVNAWTRRQCGGAEIVAANAHLWYPIFYLLYTYTKPTDRWPFTMIRYRFIHIIAEILCLRSGKLTTTWKRTQKERGVNSVSV